MCLKIIQIKWIVNDYVLTLATCHLLGIMLWRYRMSEENISHQLHAYKQEANSGSKSTSVTSDVNQVRLTVLQSICIETFHLTENRFCIDYMSPFNKTFHLLINYISILGQSHLDSSSTYAFHISLTSLVGNNSEIKTLCWEKKTPFSPLTQLRGSEPILTATAWAQDLKAAQLRNHQVAVLHSETVSL